MAVSAAPSQRRNMMTKFDSPTFKELDKSLGYAGQRLIASMPTYEKAIDRLIALIPKNACSFYSSWPPKVAELDDLLDWIDANRQRHFDVWQIGTSDEIDPPRVDVGFNHYECLHRIFTKLSFKQKEDLLFSADCMEAYKKLRCPFPTSKVFQTSNMPPTARNIRDELDSWLQHSRRTYSLARPSAKVVDEKRAIQRVQPSVLQKPRVQRTRHTCAVDTTMKMLDDLLNPIESKPSPPARQSRSCEVSPFSPGPSTPGTEVWNQYESDIAILKQFRTSVMRLSKNPKVSNRHLESLLAELNVH